MHFPSYALACEDYLAVQERLYHTRLEPGIYLAPEYSGGNIKPAPNLPLRQTMDELGKVMSKSSGTIIPISGDGFTSN